MTEQIDELEAFKDGVIHLVQKYFFGRKPRKAKKRSRDAARVPEGDDQ